jgi:hypothetical protein
MNRRTLLLSTGLCAAMAVSAKSLATDTSLPMKAADVDPAFQKAFNAGEIAPELTGHGLPLSKCEAYNRVYDQPSESH